MKGCEKFVERLGQNRRLRRIGRAGRERSQGVAERSRVIGMTAVTMNQLAELVDMLDRMLQRRLPAGKQRDNE